MRRMLLVAVLAVANASCTVRGDGSSSDEQVEQSLRAMTQELLDAIAPGKRQVWDRYLHERFVHMDENGIVRTKAELLEELDPLPQGLTGRLEIDTYSVTIHGATAVATVETQEYLDYHGQPLRSRFRTLDTWLETSAGWRLIGEHTAAAIRDPPVVSLTLQELCEYAGIYALTPAIRTTIRCANDQLVSERTGRPAARYSAELRDVFFAPGQARTRRIFTRDAGGRISGFFDRREGEDVTWTKESDRQAGENNAATPKQGTDVTPVVEIRTYELKPGTVAEFDRLVRETMPLLARWGTDVVAFGPSRDGADTYVLIRAYRSLEARDAEQAAFYGSDDWKEGPREAVLALIDHHTSVVLEESASGIPALRPRAPNAVP